MIAPRPGERPCRSDHLRPAADRRGRGRPRRRRLRVGPGPGGVVRALLRPGGHTGGHPDAPRRAPASRPPLRATVRADIDRIMADIKAAEQRGDVVDGVPVGQSSNPYDYVGISPVFTKLVALGKPALPAIVAEIEASDAERPARVPAGRRRRADRRRHSRQRRPDLEHRQGVGAAVPRRRLRPPARPLARRSIAELSPSVEPWSSCSRAVSAPAAVRPRGYHRPAGSHRLRTPRHRRPPRGSHGRRAHRATCQSASAAAQPRGGAVGARRHARQPQRHHGGRRAAHRRRLLPRHPPAHLPRRAHAVRARRRGRRRHHQRPARARGHARARRGARLRAHAGRVRAGRGQRRALRRASCASRASCARSSAWATRSPSSATSTPAMPATCSTAASRRCSPSSSIAASAEFEHIKQVLVRNFEHLATLRRRPRRHRRRHRASRASTRLTGGFQKANLIVLAARPGVGKTSLALNIAQHIATEGVAPGGGKRAGRHLQPGDERRGARRTPHVLLGARQLPQAPHRQPLAGRPRQAGAGGRRPREGRHLHRRHGRPQHVRAARQGAPPAVQARRSASSSSTTCSSWPATAAPTTASRRSATSRARMKQLARELTVPVHRRLAAQPLARGARRQGAPARRPARVGRHRAGRRHGHVHLRGPQRPGVQGRRQGQDRQAPQRPHGPRPPRLRARLHAVPHAAPDRGLRVRHDE